MPLLCLFDLRKKEKLCQFSQKNIKRTPKKQKKKTSNVAVLLFWKSGIFKKGGMSEKQIKREHNTKFMNSYCMVIYFFAKLQDNKSIFVKLEQKTDFLHFVNKQCHVYVFLTCPFPT